MAVLERSELQDSPLADLHAIADQLGLEGYRRLRKAELVDAILGGSDVARAQGGASPDAPASDGTADSDEADRSGREDSAGGRGTRRRRTLRARRSREHADGPADRGGRGPASRDDDDAPRAEGARAADGARVAEGVVELLGNGSAFLRVAPPEASDEDVYISAAQVRRCELVSGDRVSGPVRTPRRSERYPSLVRIDAINGASADQVSEGVRYDERPVSYPSERLALDGGDRTLEAIEWLTPLGRGSRAVIFGARQAGKTETLRRLLDALSGREDLAVSVVLVGARPEEVAQWREGPHAPVAALTLAASADAQDQAVERAIDAAKRLAARGSDALVAIDSLDGLHPAAARKALAAARNLRDGGSLTVVATASQPLGGETTAIALDSALTSTGRQPILDLINSGTLKPELLVGEDGAEAITKARLAAVEAAG